MDALTQFKIIEKMMSKIDTILSIKEIKGKYLNRYMMQFYEYYNCLEQSQVNEVTFEMAVRNVKLIGKKLEDSIKEIKNKIFDLNGSFLCSICQPHQPMIYK